MELYREPKVIAKGMENFIKFDIEELSFKDSLQFLNSSLEKLVENLADKAAKSESKLTFLLSNTIRLHYYISDNETENMVSNIIVET